MALKISSDYMDSLGLKVQPGGKWLRQFVKRNRVKIKWKKQEKLERIRAEKFTEETRRGWFSLLKSTLEKLNLMDKPNQIFNAHYGVTDSVNIDIPMLHLFGMLKINLMLIFDPK